MKRYDIWDVSQYADPECRDVLQEAREAYDVMRRRLLVKLCRERAESRWWRYGEEKASTFGFFDDLATALESNQPLTYFARLGEDK